MKYNFAQRALIFLIINGSHFTYATDKQDSKPRVTVIFIIDQFANSYTQKLKPFFSGALKFLMDNGVVYENAHYPHAVPETCPGHTTLSTGCYPKDHGIIANAWFTPAGKEVACDDDSVVNAALLTHEGIGSYGKGPSQIMVDNLSDQFILNSQPDSPNICYSISIKSRAAIMTANKLGKAIWFDKDTAHFTSSKAYFNQLPDWLIKYNNQKKLNKLTYVNWPLVFDKKSKAYNFKNTNNTEFAKYKESWAGSRIPLTADKKSDDPYIPIYQSPMGNTLLLELAQTCISNELNDKNNLLLWLSLSPLDYVGHNYGPDSLEAIDTIYHLDKEITNFMHFVEKKVGKNKVLFALTADHGILAMQGILKEEGVKTAHKLMYQDFIKDMNALIAKDYGYGNFIVNFQMPTFYFNQQLLPLIDEITFKQIIVSLKTYLLSKQGIKNVWTYDELDNLPLNSQAQELETFFKFQRYPGRSGQLVVQLAPYSLLTRFPEGTTHESPYNYDTHVPLIIYQRGVIEHKKITHKVFMTQFANTIAQILDIPQPSASTAQLLPGINFNKMMPEKYNEK